MTAKNINELNHKLLKEIKKAMYISSEKMLADMYDETGDFYSTGNPKLYHRTGALGDTPRTTPANISNNSVSFKVYLDTTTNYTTGDNPSMLQVLELANSGKKWTTNTGSLARDTLGKKGFWERAEKKMRRTLNKTMTDYLK